MSLIKNINLLVAFALLILIFGPGCDSASEDLERSTQENLEESHETDAIIIDPLADYSSGDLIWAKRAGGPSNCDGSALATLSDDTVVVTGSFNSTATFGEGEPYEVILESDGDSDLFIARYNPDGTLIWANRAGGTSSTVCQGITSLSDNSVVVIGSFDGGGAVFGEGELAETVLESGEYHDIFIARFNPDGALAWAKCVGGSFHSSVQGITTLSDDSIVVTGDMARGGIFGAGESNEFTVGPHSTQNFFVAQYNPDGTLEWVKSVNCDDNSYGSLVTTLSDDSIIAVGDFQDIATFGEGEPNETVLDGSPIGNVFMAHYNPDGTLAWAKLTEGLFLSNDTKIATLANDSIVVTVMVGPGQIFFTGDLPESLQDLEIGLYI